MITKTEEKFILYLLLCMGDPLNNELQDLKENTAPVFYTKKDIMCLEKYENEIKSYNALRERLGFKSLNFNGRHTSDDMPIEATPLYGFSINVSALSNEIVGEIKPSDFMNLEINKANRKKEGFAGVFGKKEEYRAGTFLSQRYLILADMVYFNILKKAYPIVTHHTNETLKGEAEVVVDNKPAHYSDRYKIDLKNAVDFDRYIRKGYQPLIENGNFIISVSYKNWIHSYSGLFDTTNMQGMINYRKIPLEVVNRYLSGESLESLLDLTDDCLPKELTAQKNLENISEQENNNLDVEMLEKLKELYDAGVLNKKECESKKQEILFNNKCSASDSSSGALLLVKKFLNVLETVITLATPIIFLVGAFLLFICEFMYLYGVVSLDGPHLFYINIGFFNAVSRGVPTSIFLISLIIIELTILILFTILNFKHKLSKNSRLVYLTVLFGLNISLMLTCFLSYGSNEFTYESLSFYYSTGCLVGGILFAVSQGFILGLLIFTFLKENDGKARSLLCALVAVFSLGIAGASVPLVLSKGNKTVQEIMFVDENFKYGEIGAPYYISSDNGYNMFLDPDNHSNLAIAKNVALNQSDVFSIYCTNPGLYEVYEWDSIDTSDASTIMSMENFEKDDISGYIRCINGGTYTIILTQNYKIQICSEN